METGQGPARPRTEGEPKRSAWSWTQAQVPGTICTWRSPRRMGYVGGTLHEPCDPEHEPKEKRMEVDMGRPANEPIQIQIPDIDPEPDP